MPDFKLLLRTRQNIVNLCTPLSLEQLNTIPQGFRNNLQWNAGHVVATQQLLTYGLLGKPLPLPADFIQAYRKGSQPEGPIDQASWAFIEEQLLASVTQFEQDFSMLSDSKFKVYSSSYGVELKNLEGALGFNQVHEGMHLGTMLAMRKLV